jgi:hypothetical protein
MFEKLSYSMSVMRASWNVLKRSPGLMLFPLLSTGACLLVIASFAVPLLMTGTHGSANTSMRTMFAPSQNSDGTQTDPAALVLHYAVLFAFYFCNYFVITFFNGALVACAVASLRGEKPSLGYGLGEAFARIHLIAGWALLSATVGVILRAVEERASFLGKIVASLLGVAWAVASYLAVPVLIMEGVGPLEAVKRSSLMLRKTWGERIVGSAGFGIITLLLMLPAVAIVAGGIAMSANGGGSTPMICAIGAAVLYVLLLSLVQSTLTSIFRAAVYLYASEPQLLQNAENQGHGFPVILLSGAMTAKV